MTVEIRICSFLLENCLFRNLESPASRNYLGLGPTGVGALGQLRKTEHHWWVTRPVLELLEANLRSAFETQPQNSNSLPSLSRTYCEPHRLRTCISPTPAITLLTHKLISNPFIWRCVTKIIKRPVPSWSSGRVKCWAAARTRKIAHARNRFYSESYGIREWPCNSIICLNKEPLRTSK